MISQDQPGKKTKGYLACYCAETARELLKFYIIKQF